MSAIRYTIDFRGRVQGVFFRATALEVARGYEVTGWVKNERDGSVLCVAEGEKAELDRFVAAVRMAKRPNIEDVRIEESPATGEFEGFNIRY